MKNIQKVWAEITANKAEVALSKEKLQLSALDDVKKAMEILEAGALKSDSLRNKRADMYQAVNKASDEAELFLSDADSLTEELKDDYATAERALDEFQTLANELGVDASDNKDWAELQSFLVNDFSDAMSNAQDYYDDANASLKALLNITFK